MEIEPTKAQQTWDDFANKQMWKMCKLHGQKFGCDTKVEKFKIQT